MRESDFSKFKEFSAAADTLNRTPHVIRGLLDFSEAALSHPIPIDEVEPVEAIYRRFTTGAMSFGSISKEAHETIAAAMNSIHCRSNSGEGGEDPERFEKQQDGFWTLVRSASSSAVSDNE